MKSKISLGKTKDSRTRKRPRVQVETAEALALKATLQIQKDFAAYLLLKGYSSQTVQSYVKDVERFTEWLTQENMEVHEVNYADILHYIQDKRGKVKQRSVSTTVNSIKHYYSYLQTTEAVTDNPTTQIQIRGIKRRILYPILSKQELESLYHNYQIPDDYSQFKNQNWYVSSVLTRKRNKVILGLLVYQGLNTQELGRLTEKDVKLREGKIFIAGSRRSNERSLKLEAHQVLDIMEYTLQVRPELLALNHQTSEALLVNGQGGNHFKNIMQPLVRQLKKQSKSVQSVKQIRTSVITHWLKLYNLREVQQMAGHRYVSSTEAYLINDLDGLHEDISQYHPIG